MEQGSEEDLEEEILTTSRSLISFMIQRKRKLFGTPIQFEDRNVEAAKDAYIECTSFEDNTFDLHRQEHDFAVQNVMETCEKACQTEWKKPRTALSQYVPRTLHPSQLEKINKSEELAKFVESVCPRFKLALQQNEIMDVFAGSKTITFHKFRAKFTNDPPNLSGPMDYASTQISSGFNSTKVYVILNRSLLR